MTDRSRNVEEVLAPRTRIEEFVIERALQSGGFGVTYLAGDRSLGRRVAIKEYLPREWGARRADGSVGPRSSSHEKDYRWGLARFLDEARTLARLDHARIVRVHRVIEAWGTAYMVMEYVEGRNLEEALRAEGPWPESRVRALLEALLPGLELVHGAGLIHRDVKPANVMLRADGTPVLIDFGAARYAAGVHSRSLTSVLTPGYAPHEQYHQTAGKQGKQGPWTDVYALGAVAYRALSGRTPVEAPARVEAAARKQADPLAPVAQAAAGGVSEAFGAAVTAALALWPEDRPLDVAAWRARWGDGAAVRSAAEAGQDGRRSPEPDRSPAPPEPVPLPAPPVNPYRRAPRMGGAVRRAAYGTAALAAAAAVAVGVAWWVRDGGTIVESPGPRAPEEAVARAPEEAVARAPECLRDLSSGPLSRGTYEQAGVLDGECVTEHSADGRYAVYYGFTLAEAAVVTVDMASGAVDSRPVIRHGPPPGSESVEAVVRNEDGAVRIARFLRPGDYTIEATTRTAGGTGEFTLGVAVGDDHGDTEDAATRVVAPLASGTLAEVPGTLVDEDEDYFAVEVETAGAFTVRTTGGMDTVGELYHDGVLLDSNDDSADRNFEIQLEAASPATYFVRVTGYDGSWGDYRFQVELDEPAPPPPTPEVEAALRLDRPARRRIQRGLAAAGFDPGAPDGVFGDGTRAALERWQEDRGRPATGWLDEEAATELQQLGRRVEEEERAAAAERVVAAEARRAAAAAEAARRRQAAEAALCQAEEGARRPARRRLWRDCEFCPTLVVIPAGTFCMGSPESEEGYSRDEGPRHEVTLRSFALGVSEVTFDEWDACFRGGGCGTRRPSDRGWGRGARPVINVSWDDAQAYVSWLSAETGEPYRLPSESEWEYAARAGTTTPFHTGAAISTDQANYHGGRYRKRTTAVRTFAPNAFGLYDVHGNVWEWVADCPSYTYRGAPDDGTASTPPDGRCPSRVLRGGSWNDPPQNLRSANRINRAVGARNLNAGFRVARTLE